MRDAYTSREGLFLFLCAAGLVLALMSECVGAEAEAIGERRRCSIAAAS